MHVTMSLDGFIAGPEAASYDVGRRSRGDEPTSKVFGGGWEGPQFVLTHRPPTDETDASITSTGIGR